MRFAFREASVAGVLHPFTAPCAKRCPSVTPVGDQSPPLWVLSAVTGLCWAMLEFTGVARAS